MPFGAISNPKKKQPSEPETTVTSVPESVKQFEPTYPYETIVYEQPQIPKILLSQIQSQPGDTQYDHPTIASTEEPSEPTQPQLSETTP